MFEPKIFMFAIIEAFLYHEGCKDYIGACLHSEGCTDIRVQISTLTSNRCKLKLIAPLLVQTCFWGAGIVIFSGVQTCTFVL